MWPFTRKQPTMSAVAREALMLKNVPPPPMKLGSGIGGSPVYDPRKSPAEQAYDAVDTALKIEAVPGGGHRIVAEAPGFFIDVPNDPKPFVFEPVTPAELSPDYHAGLASRMIERLDADAARLTDALAAEHQQHQLTITALTAELDGVYKVREAYGHVAVVLQPVEPAPACPPDEPLIINPTPHQRRKPRPGRRDTFTVPEGHEAIRDAEGRATGETRPITPQSE